MTLKNLTVRLLKDLARKHLGRERGTLETDGEPPQAARHMAPGSDGDPRSREPGASRPDQTETGEESERFDEEPAEERPAHTVAAVQPPSEPARAEPLVEGFFVARVQGEDEARRHHLTEGQVPPPLETGAHPYWIEHLPDIPRVYGDDRVVLLARDPVTAHLYWDISEQTLQASFEGLRDPRVVLRVFEFGHEVRALDVSLESLSWFVNDLTPGRTYRMELHAVSSDHISRRIAASSNPVTLPPDDVSPDTTVRFMRVDWDAPLNRMKDLLLNGRAQVRAPEEAPDYLEIVRRRWAPLPTSGSWQLLESVERIARPREKGEAPPEETRLEFGTWTIGGSSSFTMLGSSAWWSSPTSSWSFTGASRAPVKGGEGT
ncbi:MAG: DUF4912 domain-containing protein [Myxococcaceae bacterium]